MTTVGEWKGILDKYETQLKSSAQGVGIQMGLMCGISLVTFIGFSIVRPRHSKVYAPKVKYNDEFPSTSGYSKVNTIEDPKGDPGDGSKGPPKIDKGFFDWLSPVIHVKEHQMVDNIGLDATTFLRFLKMLLFIFISVSGLSLILLILYAVYNAKNVEAAKRSDGLSMITIANVRGSWMWAALAITYLINFVVIGFVWRNWQAMLLLRYRWFRSPAYQGKVYSRTLMVTHVPKSYRNDEGLVHLISQLKVDGIKIRNDIEATCIGRRLGDFPELVTKYNDTIKNLESVLVKYLKGGHVGRKRPTVRIEGTLGFGGEKKDAIEYYATRVKVLRDQIDERRAYIDSLERKQRKARKGQMPTAALVEGENYGFITFTTMAEAHRIARAHQGSLSELGGASLQLAPMPQDIIWQNIAKDTAELASTRIWGFALIAMVCFLNTLPLTAVALLANLASLSSVLPFVGSWQAKSPWTLSIVSGVLPSAVQGLFGYILPYIIRRISKYQGAQTRSRLERAVIARYFFFMIVSSFFILILLSVFFNLILGLVQQISNHASADSILAGLAQLPIQIQSAYVSMSNYWLTWLPLRGFLIFFELIQLIKLTLVSVRRLMFSYTPRDIRDLTKPPPFEYAIVVVNILFLATVGLVYAVLAPLVVIGATIAIWFSLVVYKYQLLYVYVTKAESGGRMWNVYVNRLFVSCILMQLLMILTTALVRQRWLDSIAAVPPILIILGFKIYFARTYNRAFRYYRPTEQEVEEQQARAMREKPIKHSEMEKRFVHPALLKDKLFHLMVHKMQEPAAREVLAPYPWLSGKEVKGVAEENLEYDPARHGPVDSRHKNDWDNRSIASTSALSKLDMGSDNSGRTTPALYKAQSGLAYNPQSTDDLLHNAMGPGQADPYASRASSRLGMPRGSEDSNFRDPFEAFGGVSAASVPYPPTAYGRPPLLRAGTSSSSTDQIPLVRYTSRESGGGGGGYASHRAQGSGGSGSGSGYGGGGSHRAQGSGGSGREVYSPLRGRQGSGDVVDQFGRGMGMVGVRSRQGSVGDGLDSFGRGAGARSRQGSVGDGLDSFGQSARSRQGSVGDGLDAYARAAQGSGSAVVPQQGMYDPHLGGYGGYPDEQPPRY